MSARLEPPGELRMGQPEPVEGEGGSDAIVNPDEIGGGDAFA